MMKAWNKRSDIEASLFNPAFCGELILHAVLSYNKVSKQGRFPYALSFLILPFLMTAEVYNELPNTQKTKLISRLFTKKHLTPIIAQKAKELKDYTNEALLLYLSMCLLQVDEQATLLTGENKLVRKRDFHREEVDHIIKTADFIGTWLGNAGDVVTIYSLIGITV